MSETAPKTNMRMKPIGTHDAGKSSPRCGLTASPKPTMSSGIDDAQVRLYELDPRGTFDFAMATLDFRKGLGGRREDD